MWVQPKENHLKGENKVSLEENRGAGKDGVCLEAQISHSL